MTIIRKDGSTYSPPHLSKNQDILLEAGDVVEVRTPGGGFGDPATRDPALVDRDLARGYYSREKLEAQFGRPLEVERS